MSRGSSAVVGGSPSLPRRRGVLPSFLALFCLPLDVTTPLRCPTPGLLPRRLPGERCRSAPPPGGARGSGSRTDRCVQPAGPVGAGAPGRAGAARLLSLAVGGLGAPPARPGLWEPSKAPFFGDERGCRREPEVSPAPGAPQRCLGGARRLRGSVTSRPGVSLPPCRIQAAFLQDRKRVCPVPRALSPPKTVCPPTSFLYCSGSS